MDYAKPTVHERELHHMIGHSGHVITKGLHIHINDCDTYMYINSDSNIRAFSIGDGNIMYQRPAVHKESFSYLQLEPHKNVYRQELSMCL